jgi:hypothetical protein
MQLKRAGLHSAGSSRKGIEWEPANSTHDGGERPAGAECHAVPRLHRAGMHKTGECSTLAARVCMNAGLEERGDDRDELPGSPHGGRAPGSWPHTVCNCPHVRAAAGPAQSVLQPVWTEPSEGSNQPPKREAGILSSPTLHGVLAKRKKIIIMRVVSPIMTGAAKTAATAKCSDLPELWQVRYPA